MWQEWTAASQCVVDRFGGGATFCPRQIQSIAGSFRCPQEAVATRQKSTQRHQWHPQLCRLRTILKERAHHFEATDEERARGVGEVLARPIYNSRDTCKTRALEQAVLHAQPGIFLRELCVLVWVWQHRRVWALRGGLCGFAGWKAAEIQPEDALCDPLEKNGVVTLAVTAVGPKIGRKELTAKRRSTHRKASSKVLSARTCSWFHRGC